MQTDGKITAFDGTNIKIDGGSNIAVGAAPVTLDNAAVVGITADMIGMNGIFFHSNVGGTETLSSASVFAHIVVERIANNLVTVLTGAALPGTTKTITAERERLKDVVAGRDPFAIVYGPAFEVLSRTNQSECTKVDLSVRLIEYFNDDYAGAGSPDPIFKQLGNRAGDLQALIMTDRSRGGNASNTECDAGGCTLAELNGIPVFVTYLDISCMTFVLETNPYFIGAQ